MLEILLGVVFNFNLSNFIIIKINQKKIDKIGKKLYF